MPINATYEYGLAEEEFHKAGNTEEKIKALQRMLSTAPTHKGAEKLRNEIKRKLSKAKGLLKRERGRKGGGGIFVKKDGDACACLVGITNSGKSTLLRDLTGARVRISEHEFTTLKPEVGVMDYSGVKIQIIEIPSIVRNYYKIEDGPSFLAIIRTCDIIVIVMDMLKDVNAQINLVRSELEKNGISKKKVVVGVKSKIGLGADEVKERIWSSLNLIRVYTKNKAGNKKEGNRKEENSGPPVALIKGSNVRDFAMRIHKDFIKMNRKGVKRNKKGGVNFKNTPYARVWGESAKFSGQRVGMEHVLQDRDIVELYAGG